VRNFLLSSCICDVALLFFFLEISACDESNGDYQLHRLRMKCDHYDVVCSTETSRGDLTEGQRQSVIEQMQELTGGQLDSDVIEMVLTESSWNGEKGILPITVNLPQLVILKCWYGISAEQ